MEIFNITNEAGNLSEWTTILGDAGDITASSAAALAGTNFGLAVRIDASPNTIHAQKDLVISTDECRFRFYIDPNTLTMADNDQFNCIAIQCPNEGSATMETKIGCFLEFVSGDYRVIPRLRNDNNTFFNGTPVVITDAPHFLEFHVERATDQSTIDAKLHFYVDGVFKETLSGIDLFNDWPPSQWQFGLVGGADLPSTNGTFYLDEIKANDDGTLIGPVTFSDGIRTRYSSANYNVGLRARYGPYGGRY